MARRTSVPMPWARTELRRPATCTRPRKERPDVRELDVPMTSLGIGIQLPGKSAAGSARDPLPPHALRAAAPSAVLEFGTGPFVKRLGGVDPLDRGQSPPVRSVQADIMEMVSFCHGASASAPACRIVLLRDALDGDFGARAGSPSAQPGIVAIGRRFSFPRPVSSCPPSRS